MVEVTPVEVAVERGKEIEEKGLASRSPQVKPRAYDCLNVRLRQYMRYIER